MKRERVISTYILASILFLPSMFALDTKHREYPRTKEKELRVIVEVSFGTLILERGVSNKVAIIDYEESEETKNKLQLTYDLSGSQGTLRIKLKESVKFWDDEESDDSHSERRLKLQLTDAIPISFDVELGAGKGDINVTGLKISDMRISTGASSVAFECSEPNPIVAEDVDIESGVSKFTASQLSNLNFHNLKFKGGVGSYKLDFSGKASQDADVKIEVGLGSITINVPRQIPAKLLYDDNWLSSFSLDGDFIKRRTGVYQTADFDNSNERITIKVESGLGSVKIRRK